MSMSDPIADLLTRIRNALMAEHEATDVYFSRLKSEIARILKREGYISDYVVEGGGTKKTLRIYLKYAAGAEPVIRGLKRLSKPGLRRYVGASDIPKSLGGLGVIMLSTSSGVLTDSEARQKKVGGELLCEIW